MSAEQWLECSNTWMPTSDVHAHFLPDFYGDTLLVAGLRQADGIYDFQRLPLGIGQRPMVQRYPYYYVGAPNEIRNAKRQQ